VITNRRLVEFAARYPEAARPLQAWRQLMEARSYASFAELRQCFSSIDKVGDLHVFDIGGNKYRLVVFLHFVQQIAYVKHVLTHAEYDRMAWRTR
jgi:mRNA interferase HigB